MQKNTSVQNDSQGESSRNASGPELGNGQHLFCFASAKLPASSPLGVPDFAPGHAIWKGSEPSITDPSKSNSLEVCTVVADFDDSRKPVWLKHLGIDWLSITVSGSCRNADARDTTKKADAELLVKLEHFAQIARELHADVVVEFGGYLWTMKPHGHGVGLNYFRYVLQAGPVLLMVSNQLSEKAPVAHLTVTGEFCHGVSPQSLLKMCRKLLHRCSIDATAMNLTRLDVCFDVVGRDAGWLYLQKSKNRIIRRAKTANWDESGEGFSSVVFGRRGGDVVLRVYDKTAELKANEEKSERYRLSKGWDEIPEGLTRYEFELRSEFFRETMRFKDAEAVFDSLDTVAGYLMHENFRVCDGEVDRDNTAREESSEWWRETRSQLMAFMGGRVEFKPYPRPRSTMKKLKPQLLGLLAKACGGVLSVNPGTVAAGMRAVLAEFTDLDDVTFSDKCENACRESVARIEEFEAWQGAVLADVA